MRHFAFFTIVLVFFFTVQPAQADSMAIQSAMLWHTTNHFQTSGAGIGYQARSDGLALAQSRMSGGYISPVFSAPVPFNAVVPEWTAVLPPHTDIHLLVRTGISPDTLGSWTALEAHADFYDGATDQFVGDMLATANGQTHLQYYLILSRAGVALDPLVQQIGFTFIDSSQGPTTEELIAQQEALDAQLGINSPSDNPRPPVVSRAVWCQDPACNYGGVGYSPTRKLIVHHTVSNNGIVDWATNVRAIWYFHAFSRGWGDIGYNYLVDPNGVLYEGHLGGDNVTGTHAADANRGTMALALLGNFTSFDPTAPMLQSAIDLFAWKAEQQGIDVYGADDSLPDVSWGLPNLMGHRDVYGGTNTECPGTEAYEYLPWLRDQVAARIGLQAPITIDENGSHMTLSNATWYTADALCGHDLNAYYTWSTQNGSDSSNWGEWDLSWVANGRYELTAYIPYCINNSSETSGARYQIHHADGMSVQQVNQFNHVGEWVSLGEYTLDDSSYLRLTDLTSTDTGLGVWFDAVRLRPIDYVPIATSHLSPPDEQWLTTRQVPLAWQIVHPEEVATTQLTISPNPDLSQPVYEQTWDGAVDAHTAILAEDHALLYWQVHLTAPNGFRVASTPTRFQVDATPPFVGITLLEVNPYTDQYTLGWEAVDNLNGITTYGVQYRPTASAEWQTVADGLTTTAYTFVSEMGEFRAYAYDGVGNAGGSPPVHTSEATSLYNPAILPIEPAFWVDDLTVTFQWRYEDMPNPQAVRLQASSDPDFEYVLLERILLATDTSYTHTFSQEYPAVYWRVVVTFAPEEVPSGLTRTMETVQFGLDVSAPTAVFLPLHSFSNTYLLTWQGEPDASGIVGYHLDYRVAGSNSWTRWQTDFVETSVLFEGAGAYEFRLTAVDGSGKTQLEPALLQTSSATPFPHQLQLPIVRR